MKWFISCLLTGAILFQQSSCKEDPPKPLTELEKLPPETKIGKRTFGCLINGKAFVPNSTSDVSAVFQQGILQISGAIDYPLHWVGISLIENGDILRTGIYNLTSPPYQEARCYYAECYYYEEHTTEGSVALTLFDKVNYIISGTFDFTTVAPGCDTLSVTDGRFDIKYIP